MTICQNVNRYNRVSSLFKRSSKVGWLGKRNLSNNWKLNYDCLTKFSWSHHTTFTNAVVPYSTAIRHVQLRITHTHTLAHRSAPDVGACSLVCRPWQLPGGNFFQGEGYLADVCYPLAYPLPVSPMSGAFLSCACRPALPVRGRAIIGGSIINFLARRFFVILTYIFEQVGRAFGSNAAQEAVCARLGRPSYLLDLYALIVYT